MLTKGTRVELHPATSNWIMGDRYGEIVGYGHKREYRNTFNGTLTQVQPYRVKLDKSGKTIRLHPENVMAI
jgi:hypothetical protein